MLINLIVFYKLRTVTCKKSLFIWSFILSVDIKLVLKDIYVNVD